MKASRCDLFLVEAWREGESRGVIFPESIDRTPNVRLGKLQGVEALEGRSLERRKLKAEFS